MKRSFRARAHILKLLGDELIGDDRLAVFELVKNSYDADATDVRVILNLNDPEPYISIEDNGTGMSEETIVEKWLEIGTSSKRSENKVLTNEHNRYPLGEKGVGRLAAHKLGKEQRLLTRAKNENEVFVRVRWDENLSGDKNIDETSVDIRAFHSPRKFSGDSTGTCLKITKLERSSWTRRDVRSLKKLISTLVSPFISVDGFSVALEVPGHEAWLSDIFDVADILDNAIWKFDFSIEGAKISWRYEFNPPSLSGVKKNVIEKVNENLRLIELNAEERKRLGRQSEDISLIDSDLDGIGNISGSFFIYYRRSDLMKKVGNTQQLKEYLDEQTGVRVYRDGIRVYNYGEVGDDWLGLNVRRINKPSERMATNSVIAALNLSLADSNGLREKTNREGFDENPVFLRFRHIVQSVVELIDITRQDDRRILDAALKGRVETGQHVESFEDAVSVIKTAIKKKGLDDELKPHIETIEREYKQVRNVMVNSGLAGLNLATIFHEVEREIGAINKGIENNESLESLKKRTGHLVSLLDGFAPLLKRNSKKRTSASAMVMRVIELSKSRLDHHGVLFSSPLLSGESEDFVTECPPNLVIGALRNLVDNSMYWARARAEKEGGEVSPFIYITSFSDSVDTHSIAVVDNGSGFELPIEIATQPFETTKPGGMGLGLYFANLVMESIGGAIVVMTAEELRDFVPLPALLDGVAVILKFKNK
ncbi:ATP-binding protein [Burkholderia cepacia]|uniref:ATP-binding protein n=1 Tax=Burkholderia cepacia TaxID=292 RepID=UPI00158E18E9|nr:ATP-binding protein [Burkholderia cepacia]MDN7899120.1 ATP-binding protein [Burkholderia cepacia]